MLRVAFRAVIDRFGAQARVAVSAIGTRDLGPIGEIRAVAVKIGDVRSGSLRAHDPRAQLLTVGGINRERFEG